MANGDTMAKEAGEHIENIQRGLHMREDEMTCRTLHGDCARAIVWCIRKIEVLYKRWEDKATKDFNDRNSGPTKTLRLWPGSQIPLERGFAPRDAIALVVAFGLIYIIIQLHVHGVFQ